MSRASMCIVAIGLVLLIMWQCCIVSREEESHMPGVVEAEQTERIISSPKSFQEKEEGHEVPTHRMVEQTKKIEIMSSAKMPNGPPGESREFRCPSSDCFLTSFVPLHRRKGAAALPFILDKIRWICNLAPTGDAATALSIALGRTRLEAVISVACLESIRNVEEFLWRLAPSWYVAERSKTSVIVLRRRLKLFVFSVTGGSNDRAIYAERTWGQRTPTQWFADSWSDQLRPIVDLHPMYVKDKFKYFTFKMSRIWRVVYRNYYVDETHYDWFVRVWDDNYLHEENLYNCLGRFPSTVPRLVGKIGYRYLSNSAIFPFAGGGAGWYLSSSGMDIFGRSIDRAEKWFVEFRARKDIYLPHFIHDEDVFLTAWLHLQNISFMNIPGLEHVSPGVGWRQRCLNDTMLFRLRWDKNFTILFDYPAKDTVKDAKMLPEKRFYSFTKPNIWHYMSPSRLVKLETLLYPERASEVILQPPFPLTDADRIRRGRKCYPGIPDKLDPKRGFSMFEVPLPDPV